MSVSSEAAIRLPDLSHLQIAVLGFLLTAEHHGREIRDELTALAVRQSGPAFYQMMARLEDAGLAEGWYSQQVVSGQIIKERCYRITPAGRRAWREAQAFYRRLFSSAEQAISHA